MFLMSSNIQKLQKVGRHAFGVDERTNDGSRFINARKPITLSVLCFVKQNYPEWAKHLSVKLPSLGPIMQIVFCST